MENNNESDVRLVTSAQEVLIKKILSSRKLLDKEYRQLRIILDNQVVTSYDASVFIEYVLATLKFRRTFMNGKRKAYKKCRFCNSRDFVRRYWYYEKAKTIWSCENCALNIGSNNIVPVKEHEKREAAADLYKKYEYDPNYSKEEYDKDQKNASGVYDYPPEQEDFDEDLRHEDLE